MAILNKLPTKDRMPPWGLAVDSMCVFCRSSIEDRDHLFFQSSITKRIWDNIMGLCLVSDAKTYWKELVNWGEGISKLGYNSTKRKGIQNPAIWEINYALPPIPCLEVDFG
ncbi:hypothetical protein SO802_009031 [Lithocarpus litseifolius]|uniref:Reverse transcriptase zinc-binding domain-containing protein n=1 Tax=Lithocarpus litseifolius TaxID=425828 RepID=A0AAW2DBB3_9ROSI